MNNVKKYIFPTVAVVCLLAGFLIGDAVSNKVNAQRFVFQNGQFYQQPSSKIDQLMQLMQTAYVDELDIDSITDEVMQDIVQKLDPHSAYIPKKDLEMVNSELSSSFSGIGVQFTIQNDTINIVAVVYAVAPCAFSDANAEINSLYVFSPNLFTRTKPIFSPFFAGIINFASTDVTGISPRVMV